MTVTNFDRATLEQIYPREIWESEAALNSQGRSGMLRGLLIEASTEGDGGLNIRRAVRPLGDTGVDGSSRAFFVCPYMGRAYDIFMPGYGGHGAVVEKHSALEDISPEYERFIDGVIKSVSSADLHYTPLSRDRMPRG